MDAALNIARRFVTLPLDKRKAYFHRMLAEKISPANLPVPAVKALFDCIPLSFAQQRQWFLWQMDPNDTAYNMPVALRLKGALDVPALRASFAALVSRHETLRTTFRLDGNQAIQVILPSLEVELRMEALGEASGAALETVLKAMVEAEVQRPFDLLEGPLVRVMLLRLSAQEHVLVLTLHHIVSDGWSMPIMVDELVQLYEGYCSGMPVDLPALPIQYADYAIWQRQWMEAGEQERQLAYWKVQLGEEQPVLQLPIDRPRPAVQNHAGASLTIELGDALAQALKSLAQQQGTTLFMLLLASFQALLHRYSGQDDIRVGVPIANRNRVETERLIGFFVNTQVFRAELALHTTFTQLLQQVRQASLGAQAHQDLPFEQLVDALQPERSLSHSPLFQVMYNHQISVKGNTRRVHDLNVEGLAWDTQTAQFDLTLDTFESATGIGASLTYATALFDRPVIARLAVHWRQLLEAIVQQPHQRVAELALLSPAEHQQIVHDWNRTAAAYPGEQCIHQLIEAQAARTPDAAAILFDDQRLTYRQLNQQANQLAHRLRELGVGPDVLVGIALERSPQMVVGLLAVLKAGGAYVPLDPEYPRERVAYMMEDSQALLLLSQSSLQQRLPAGGRAKVLLLDQLTLAGYSPANLANLAHPENLAYSIYTSGSTGKPKGVQIEHRNAAALIGWAHSVYSQDDLQGVLASTSICFDLSVWELFVTLSAGGYVVLANNALQLPQLPAKAQVRLINTVPSAIQALLDAGQLPSTVRIVNLAGEPLKQALVDALYRTGHVEYVYDLYGPSEDTTYSTYTLRTEGGRANIGRPLANSAVYLLGNDSQPVPIGSAGELCLTGAGLARGYLGRPGLTAQVFLPDPFDTSVQGGGRLYRTGDLARYDAEGVIEYAGRIDHQVKIRGFRIELGEIEARLLAHEAVGKAVVIDQQGPTGKQLVAYLVADAAQAGQANDATGFNARLREHLKAALPDYMVPAHFVRLEALPLTPNGKLDRKALPAPDLSQSQASYVAPHTELQQQLAHIWAEVLKAEQVGLTDNFFELGGDSIISIQVVSRARQAGIQMTPKMLFQCPTIGDLAATVDTAEGDPAITWGMVATVLHALTDEQVEALPISHQQVMDIYPLSPMQQGMLFQGLNGSAAELYVNQLSIPVVGLQVERFRAAWQAVFGRHDILRTGFVWQDIEQPVQFVLRSLQAPLEVMDWRDQAGQDPALQGLMAAEKARGFDLATPPLQRIVLVQLDDDRHQLIWTYHHILIDGWSISQLIGEVLASYSGMDLPSPLPYRNYIAWLQRQDSVEAQAFWRRQLEPLEQPTYLANTVQSSVDRRGHKALYSDFDSQATAQLKRFAQSQQITLNTLIQGAWLLLLSRYTGQRSVAFGATVSGRAASLPGAETMLGLFINTLPVIQHIDPQKPAGQWLRELQSYNLEMREREFTTLADIQRWAGAPGQSLFDSIIVFENQPVNQTLSAWQDDTLQFGECTSTGLTDFAMDLMVTVGEQLQIEFMYLQEHFAEAAVADIRRNMEGLLWCIASDATQPLGNVGLATTQPLVPSQPSLPRAFVHEQIALQSMTRGPALAVTGAGGELSFVQLEGAANRLAHALIARGVGPEVRVGVALPRSEQIIVALLAVLKAGGAYVPLDSSYPSERLAYQMSDSGIALLLTDSAVSQSLPVPAGTLLLELDLLDLAGMPSTAPVVTLHAENLAYIIYTSGSTGQPKGVAVCHGPLAMHCQAVGERYEMCAQDCELHFMSFAFDGAHERWLTTLSHGGRLVIRGDDLWTPEQTFDAMHRHAVTVAAFPPVYLQQIAEHAQLTGNPPPVRIYCFGGDAVPQASFDLVKTALRPQFIINGYGPTETVVTPLIWKAGHEDTCDAAYAPIGSRVGNRTTLMLDNDLNLLGRNLAGELYLGGKGLARGYLGRPGLTAERFVPDPCGAQGQRLYRSADLVRQRNSGVFDYLGRIDQQIKIRGFRIELGEIEAALVRLEGVDDAIVVAREIAGGKQLVAYVTGRTELVGEVLRTALRACLPDYMVPLQVQVLLCFPLTPNGKIDRKALPEPHLLQATYREPRNEQERVLTQIWGQLLQLENVGIEDNFFELGGDSILSLQVVSRVRNHPGLNMDLKLRDLLQYQTIAGISERALESHANAPEAYEPEALEGAFRLLPIQEWLFAEGMAEPQHFNQALMLRSRRALDLDALEQAMLGVEQHHDALRLRFTEDPGRWSQRYVETTTGQGLLWRRQAADTAALTALANECQRSLDLQAGPLWRALHVEMAGAEARILLVIHHLVVDTVSWRVLLEDVQMAYEAYSQGRVPQWPVRTSTYRSWVERLAAEAPAIAKREATWWLAQLEQPGGEVPCDNPRGRQLVSEMVSCREVLPTDLTRQLLKEAPAAYRTQINDLLLTALSRALCQWSGEPSVLVQLEGHGREDLFESLDLSRTVGWFTSMFPVRLTPTEELRGSILATQQQLAQVPHKGIGYGVLRYLGEPSLRERLASLPQARVTFNYMGQFDQSFDDKALLLPAPESSGDCTSPHGKLANWLEIVGHVYDGRLTLRCDYSCRRYRPHTVEALMRGLREQLEAIVGHCLAQQS